MYVLVLISIGIGILANRSLTIRENQCNDLVFEKTYCDSLKAIFTLLIVIHHLGLIDIPFGNIYDGIGFVCVAGFFTVSGWGTAVSLQTSYSGRQYYTKKILNLGLPYIFAFIIYSMADLLRGGTISEILADYVSGTPTVLNSWYLIALIYMYFSHWLCVKIGRGTLHKVFFIFSAVIYFVIVRCLDWPANWYQTFYIYYLAALLQGSTKAKKWIANNGKTIIVLSFLLFLISFGLYNYFKNKTTVQIIAVAVCSISFMILILVGGNYLAYKKNKIAEFVSRISLEIYLYHAAVIGVVKSLFTNEYLIIIFTIVVTVLVSYIIRVIWERAVLWVRYHGKNRQV